MKYTTVHFPRDLLVSQGLASSSGRHTWMLVRRWRIMLRRVVLVAVPVTLLVTVAAFIVVLVPLARVSKASSSTYVLICLEQVAWVLGLSLLLHVYLNRRSWLAGGVAVIALLLFIKGAALTAFHLESLFCARPTFGNKFVFTVPFYVPCSNGTCTLTVVPEEQPPLCSSMHDMFHEMGPSGNPGVVADIMLTQHVLQTLLALLVIVHGLEDQLRLGY